MEKPPTFSRLAHQLDGVMETVWVWLPIGHALGGSPPNASRFSMPLSLSLVRIARASSLDWPITGQVAHDFDTAASMNRVDQINGSFARASARPVRNRTKAWLNLLDDFDLVKKVFLAFIRLWRKELDRKCQP
jgi:hypothetical protein